MPHLQAAMTATAAAAYRRRSSLTRPRAAVGSSTCCRNSPSPNLPFSSSGICTSPFTQRPSTDLSRRPALVSRSSSAPSSPSSPSPRSDAARVAFRRTASHTSSLGVSSSISTVQLAPAHRAFALVVGVVGDLANQAPAPIPLRLKNSHYLKAEGSPFRSRSRAEP